jgi:hypothetical protein
MINSMSARLSGLERQIEQLDSVRTLSKVDHESLMKQTQQITEFQSKDFVLRADVVWWLEHQQNKFQENVNALRTEFLEREEQSTETVASKLRAEATAALREELGPLVRGAVQQEREDKQRNFLERQTSKGTNGNRSVLDPTASPFVARPPSTVHMSKPKPMDPVALAQQPPQGRSRTTAFSPKQAYEQDAANLSGSSSPPLGAISDAAAAVGTATPQYPQGDPRSGHRPSSQQSARAPAEVEAARKEAGVVAVMSTLPSMEAGGPAKRQPPSNSARKKHSPKSAKTGFDFSEESCSSRRIHERWLGP